MTFSRPPFRAFGSKAFAAGLYCHASACGTMSYGAVKAPGYRADGTARVELRTRAFASGRRRPDDAAAFLSPFPTLHR